MNVYRTVVLLCTALMIASLPGQLSTRGEEIRGPLYSGLIATDTTWTGGFTFSNVTVGEGVTLTIAPGSTGEGTPGAHIYVEGNLIIGGDAGPPVTMDSASSSPWGYIQVNSTGRAVVRNALISNSTVALYCHPGGDVEIRNSTIKNAEGGILSRGSISAFGVTFQDILEDALTLYNPVDADLGQITALRAGRGIVVENPRNLTVSGVEMSEIGDTGMEVSGGGEGVTLRDIHMVANTSGSPHVGLRLLGEFSDFRIENFRPDFFREGLHMVGRGVLRISGMVSMYCGMDLNISMDGKLYVNNSFTNSYGGSYFRHLAPGRCDVYYYDSYAAPRRTHPEDDLTTFTVYKNITVSARDQMGRSLSFNLTVYPYGISHHYPPTYQGYVEEEVKLWLPLFFKKWNVLIEYQPYNFTFTAGRARFHSTLETAGVNWKMNRFSPTINLPPAPLRSQIEVEEDGVWTGTTGDLFEDPDGMDDLTLISASWGEGIELFSEGENLTLSTTPNWSGLSWLNLTVRDEFWNASALEEYEYIGAYPLEGLNGTANITVVVSPVNDPPTLLDVTYSNGTSLGRRTVSAGEGMEVSAWVANVMEDVPEEFFVAAEDPDGDPLTLDFSWVGEEAGYINTDGLNFTYTPEENSTQGGLVRFNLSDSRVGQDFWVLFVISPLNDPPTLPAFWNLSVNAGENLSVDLREVIYDPDTPFDQLQISIVDTLASFESPYLIITAPGTVVDEDYQVQITVSDGEGEASTILYVHVKGTGEVPEGGEGGGGGGNGGGDEGEAEGLPLPYVLLAIILVILLGVAAVLLKRRGGVVEEE